MLCPQCICFLQGEHGTGRNVAPFVEMEWGSKAYELMWELKHLFDPTFVLNPGVVLNKVGTPPPPSSPSSSADSQVCTCLRLPYSCSVDTHSAAAGPLELQQGAVYASAKYQSLASQALL